MSQHIRGFYKSAGTSARITHIVGTGGNNQTEKITVQASQADDQYRPTAEFERSVSTDESEFGPLMGESHIQPRRAEQPAVHARYRFEGPLRRDCDDNGQHEQYESGCVSSLGRRHLSVPKLRTWITTGSPMAWRMLPDGLKDPDDTELPESQCDGRGVHPSGSLR